MCQSFQFQFQMGWAVHAAQRLRLQHGSISHPQKIPSKYWVLTVRGRNSNKKAQLSLTNPRDACEKFARFT